MCDFVNLQYIDYFFPRLQYKPQSVLEVGSYNVNGNCKSFITGLGLPYYGSDIKAGPDVDVICDITKSDEVESIFREHPSFDLIICMNVLEHLYKPINALENMCSLLSQKGYLLIVVPIIWDLHDYPADFYRLNPDFFKSFAGLNKLNILENSMLFSLRDNCQFFSDIKKLPYQSPCFGKNFFKKFLFRKLTKKHPELKPTFSHTYLNLILDRAQ